MNAIQVHAIPALEDNYIWLLTKGERAVLVDPGESAPALAALDARNLRCEAILLTHKHADHVGGVAEIVEALGKLPILGPEETRAWANHLVQPEQRIRVLDEEVRVILSNGHTEEHVSFYFEQDRLLFCGDALFSGGCGRVFTQDYAAQFETLTRFLALPDETQIYAGHEYTQTNLRFLEQAGAAKINSCGFFEWQDQVALQRQRQQPTLPTTLKQEKRFNLFLRAGSVESFKALRLQRDQFRG